MKLNRRPDLDAVFALTLIGDPLIKAVYTVLDYMMKAIEPDILCRDGCSNCCYQMVWAYPVEWRYIESWLNKLPRKLRREIIGSSRSDVEWWRKQKETDPYILMELWGERPCPFLRNDRCSIYEVRPSKCRSAFSKVPCTRDGNVMFHEKLEGACDALFGDVDKRFPRVAIRGYGQALVKMMMESELYGRG